MLPISLLLPILALTTSLAPPTNALPIPSSFRGIALGTLVRRSSSSFSSIHPSFERQLHHAQQQVQQRQEQRQFFFPSSTSHFAPNAGTPHRPPILGPILHILDEPLTSSEVAEEVRWSTLISSSSSSAPSSPVPSPTASDPPAPSQRSATLTLTLNLDDLVDLDSDSIYAGVLDPLALPLPSSSAVHVQSSRSPPRRHLKPKPNANPIASKDQKPKTTTTTTTTTTMTPMRVKGKRTKTIRKVPTSKEEAMQASGEFMKEQREGL